MDPQLVEMLRPDRPIESEALRKGRDGRLYYVATLREKASQGYAKAYETLIVGRGLYIRAHLDRGGGRTGFDIRAFRRTSKPGFALYSADFWDKRDEQEREYEKSNSGLWCNYPGPITVDGREVRVRLGRRESPWRDLNILPKSDLQEARELPFARFPGAIVISAGADEYGMVSRLYQVVEANGQAVLTHYESECRRMGIAGLTRTGGGALQLEGDGDSDRVITRVSVGHLGSPLDSVIANQPFNTLFPRLCRDLPPLGDLYVVRLWFGRPDLTEPYAPKKRGDEK